MSDAETESIIDEAVSNIAFVLEMRNIGHEIVGLEAQIAEKYSAMDGLWPGVLEIPYGSVMRVATTQTNHPMYVEEKVPGYHNDDAWQQVFPHDYERLGGPKLDGVGYTWQGNKLEYDTARRIWLYNRSGSLRVLFDYNVKFDGIAGDPDIANAPD